jgi:hypothetical protein
LHIQDAAGVDCLISVTRATQKQLFTGEFDDFANTASRTSTLLGF